MANTKVAVYISVAILGGLASIFGIIGAFNGVKQANSDSDFSSDLGFSFCTWPSSPAAGLGITGCFLILVAQITSNASGGCVCCCAKNSSSISSAAKIGAILCLLFSWLLTIVASVLLFVGGVLNSGAIHMTLVVYDSDYGGYGCYYPPTVHLLIGGVVSLLATGLSLIFFGIVSSGSSVPNDNNSAIGQAIATGYPQGAAYNVQMTNKSNEAPQPAAGTYHAAIPVVAHANYGSRPTTAAAAGYY